LTDKDIEEALKTNAKEIAEHFPQFSLKLIRDTVAKTRARGFALNPGLLVPGSWGFALPITGPDGTCTGAITVAGVQQRFENQRLKQLTALVANEIKIIEQNLKNPALITRSKRPPKHVEQLDEEP
jgi:DNA-binding IclR family transcriptional regulator